MARTPNLPTTQPIETIKVLADIIQNWFGVDDDHIGLAYERKDIPEDGKLYIVLSYAGPGTIIGCSSCLQEDGTELISVAMQQMIQVDFMSFSSEARIRKEEFQMATKAIYSRQQQEINSMQIARNIGPFVDASSLEETKWLNRFTTLVPVKSLHKKAKTAQYFETFSAEFATDTMPTDTFVPANPANPVAP